ncbi:AraC family transcriptional regulator [uncultured Desulfovibrio sp.]|uniref:AraC family transcriptional regulator n=1 Tax=uncultured Desulfovibrio sp. TaxID=167968 RepID=UPI001C3B8C23|nr:AraC family transcriptional regulator [uncultured Desulfovibrio sp.]HIX40318.1 AraC family transcriptional regulator [Candidatus Desulfovibrio intestinigallinarum]
MACIPEPGLYGADLRVCDSARLIALMLRLLPQPGQFDAGIGGLTLFRYDAPQDVTCFTEPSVGLVVQGCKESLLGTELLRYGVGDAVVIGVPMPAASRILAASPEEPLLIISVGIDRNLVRELAVGTPEHACPVRHRHLGASVAPATQDMLDAFFRLTMLLEQPQRAPLMAPLLLRELIFHVLAGPQGADLRAIYAEDSCGNKVAQAIAWLQEHYKSPLNVPELARQVGMAASSFHRHFKQVTSISPLQFQKRLRLHEARRLMRGEQLDAGSAGRAVGYESPSQFSREYKRLFGQPPGRHGRSHA